MYDRVYNLKVSDFDLVELKGKSYQVLNALFSLRMEIRDSFNKEFFSSQNYQSQKNVDAFYNCALAHRRLFRALRNLEDYVGMLGGDRIRQPGQEFNFPDDDYYRVFKGQKENFMWNESYLKSHPQERQSNELEYVPRSGDVLLSRGNAVVSAAIARITNEDSNFSHIGMVYVDPVTKKVETIEAHIEYGTLVADISDYSDMKVRGLVFRFNDPKLNDKQNAEKAHNAATKVRALVQEYAKKYNKDYSHNQISKFIREMLFKESNDNFGFPNICYDFSMVADNPLQLKPSKNEDRKCLFCSEVVSLAFKLLDPQGQYQKVPTFMSSIKPKNDNFIRNIGVRAPVTFAPADIEIDPYFELVLEWRDFKRIHRSHILDAVLTSLYGWMDEKNYNFKFSAGKKVEAKVIYDLRRWPLFDKLVEDAFPKNLRPEGIAAMRSIDKIGSRLHDYLFDIEERTHKTLSPAEMIKKLEAWRVEDLRDYTQSKKMIDSDYATKEDKKDKYRFHHFFNAFKENEF